MSKSITKKRAEEIVKELLTKAHNRYKQELLGENEEFLDRLVRQHSAKVSRCSWKAAQKWCKFDKDGPVLMPDYTRIYYRKGVTEIVVQEYPPHTRILKFKGSLANRQNSEAEISEEEYNNVHHYSLSLPYVVFIFKFVNGLFSEVRCAFSDRPLKRLEERPLRPYLSNIDGTLNVCLGQSFQRDLLQKDNVAQQAALVLSHFWHSIFSDEWSTHYWNSKTHFGQNDARMATLDAWQDTGTENPLFVVEDVAWLTHTEENFGDIIVRMFEGDTANNNLSEGLYKELVETFLADVKKTLADNIESVESKVTDANIEQLAEELLEKLAN
jgi:hypothetical protein